MKYEKFEMKDGYVLNIPSPTCYKDCIKLLQSDFYRRTGNVESLFAMWKKTLYRRPERVHFWFRFAQYKGIFYPICIMMHKRNARKFSVQWDTAMKVGWGFYAGNTAVMFINRRAIIGNNVNISHILNAGSSLGESAMIGDNVYIGPMTALVEGVQIGHDSIIGTGSVVTRDIPANSTAVGTPAKVIGGNNHPGFISRKWPIDNPPNK